MDSNNITNISNRTNINLLDFRELVKYKSLLYFLVLRDVKVFYKQSILGFSWAVLRPFISMVIFTIIFGMIAGIKGDGLPYSVATYTALIPWTYFSGCVTASGSSLLLNSNILNKVYFPRIIFPIVPILSKFVDFILSFSMLIILMAWYKIMPTTQIIYIPFLIIVTMIFSLGLGFAISAMSVQYRDVNHAMQFMIQILMYASPIIWPLSYVPEKYMFIYSYYPMAGVIEGFRSCLSGNTQFPWDMLLKGFIVSVILFFVGLYIFKKMEKIFADVI